MSESARAAHRAAAVGASLSLSDRLFASTADRALARTIDAGLERIEAGLLDEVKFTTPIAEASTRYLLEAGGKRVRPMLTVLTAQLGDGTTDEVVTAARAIEITHLASLYHDDVMDESDRRRGVPSAQKVWGNSVAILTGDLLFARASQLMARIGERAIRMQADTFERLVLGQLNETVGPQPGADPIAHYIQVLADKTGSLIAASGQAGVLFSNANPVYEQAVVDFGERIGVAFQLADDVIDLSAQPAETGKVPGTDLRAGVVTLPLLLLRASAATNAADAALLARIDAGDITDDLVAEVREHRVTTETLAEARRWATDAVAALAPLPEGGVKHALARFAESLVSRAS